MNNIVNIKADQSFKIPLVIQRIFKFRTLVELRTLLSIFHFILQIYNKIYTYSFFRLTVCVFIYLPRDSILFLIFKNVSFLTAARII